MKSKILALMLGIAASSAAIAGPTGYTFGFTNIPIGWNGQFEIKFQNYESFTNGLTVGSDNYGVLKITSIVDPVSGNTLWADGNGGAEITGVFNNINITSVTSNLGGVLVNSTGGHLDLFLNTFGTFGGTGGFGQGTGGYAAGGCAINQLCYNGISNGGGSSGSFLSANWVPGVINADPVTTVSGEFTGITNPFTGKAAGYLAIVAGSGPYASTFDSNGFIGGSADLFAQNDFCTPDGTGSCPAAGDWDVRSNDPVRGALRVPEPASLALVGIALFGLGVTTRRRKI